MTESKELAPFEVKEVAQFGLFQDMELEISELLEENLGDEELKPEDLTRITVPAGGGTIFEIPTVDGDLEAKEIEVIILKVTPVRLFWRSAYGEGEQTPPDCKSCDLINGVGAPGGKCADCPMNEFRSAQNGEGKACSERRNLFVLPANALLPYNMSCPTKSIDNLKKYQQELIRAGKTMARTTTLISLEKDTSKGGIKYSKLYFKPGRPLTKEQAAIVKQYRESFAQVLNSDQPGNGNNGDTPKPDFENVS